MNKMETDESDADFEGCTPPDIVDMARSAISNILPEKSKVKYEAQYKRFMVWCEINKVTNYTENVLLAYFSSEKEKFKSSTLWSHYSMLRTTLLSSNNVDIKTYPKLISFLKRLNVGYRAKKSKILTRDQINKFILESPDDDYLLMKVN